MLFDYAAPQYARYTNAFNSRDYRKNLAAAERYDKGVQNYKTYGQAAYGTASGVASMFGPIGGLVSLGIQLANAGQGIGMSIKQKQLHKRLEKEARYNETPGFDYGYDVNGQFFETKQNVPLTSLDPLLPVGAGLSTGVNAVGNYFGKNFNNEAFGFKEPSGLDAMGQDSLPSRSSADVLGNVENPYGQSVIDNPSADYANDYSNGAIDLTNSDYGITGFYKGGSVNVDGGKMKYFGSKDVSGTKDNIALVDTDTGKDTGVRVSEGEKIIISKANIAALHKAISKGDQKKVFGIMKEQISKTGSDGNFAGGGVLPKEYLEVVEKVTGKKDKKDFTRDEWFEIVGQLSDSKNPYKNMSNDVYDAFNNAGYIIPDDDFQRNNPQSLPTMGEDYRLPSKSNLEVLGAINTTGRNPNTDNSYASGYSDVPRGKPRDWRDGVENAVGYGYDAYRLIEGMQGANTKVPEFHKSGDWMDYLGRMRLASQRGFSPIENAQFRTQQDRQYGADVANIRNFSGGSNAIALGNLGRANMQQYLGNVNYAAQDAAMQRANLAAYGGAVTQDMGYNRQIFNDKLNQTMLTKQAGAQLSRDAIQNMKERAWTDRYFGPNSNQAKLQDMYGVRMQDENEILRAQKERYLQDPNAFNANVSFGGTWNVDKLGLDDDEIIKDGYVYTKRRKVK